MIDKFARIGFSLPAGLPHKEYAISDGRVSVILDQSGHLNMIEYLGEHRLDPRRGAFFANGVWRRPALFEEPVIEFRPRIGGKPVELDFRNLSLCPFGVAGSFEAEGVRFDHRLWICGELVAIEWKAFGLDGRDASLSVLVREEWFKHLNEKGYSFWEEPAFDDRYGALRYNLRRRTAGEDDADNAEPAFAYEAAGMIAGLGVLGAEVKDAEGRELRIPFGADGELAIGICFGNDPRIAEWTYYEALERRGEMLDIQVSRYEAILEKTPVLESSGNDEPISEMIRTSPLFCESTTVYKNRWEAGYRPSTRGYTFHNGWDGQFGHEVLNTVLAASAKPFLNWLDASRGPNGAVTIQAHFDHGPVHNQNYHTPYPDSPLGDGHQVACDSWAAVNLHQDYFQTGDREQLERSYPSVARAFRKIRENCSEYGLVGSCTCSADHPDQVNRPSFENPRDNCNTTSRLCGSGDMGVFYNGCNCVAELAAIKGDTELMKSCVDMMQRLETNFEQLFVDQDAGFLIDSVWWKDDPVNSNRSFFTASLLALYGYGELLMLDSLERMSEFTRTRLRHPKLGLRGMPEGQKMRLERSCNWLDDWLQNQTKETLKLARLAGDMELLDLQLGILSRTFADEKVIRENLYYAEKGGHYNPDTVWQSQSWWQVMTASAWWRGMLESVAGVRYERGRVEYFYGDSGRDVQLQNLHWGGKVWDFSVRGRGKWVDVMKVNGRSCEGSYQVPATEGEPRQRVEISKTDRAPSTPVLLSSGGAQATVTGCGAGKLALKLDSPGFARIWFFSPGRPVLKVNGKEQEYRWSENRSEGHAMVLGKGTVGVSIGL